MPMMPAAADNAVALRELAAEDVDVFFGHQREPEATEMAAFSARDAAGHRAHWSKIVHDETVVVRTVLVAGEVAGYVVSYVFGGQREVGYWLGREFWGRGVATTALAEFLRLLAERPLYAHVATRNLASIRVLEKCGFVRVSANQASNAPGEFLYRLD